MQDDLYPAILRKTLQTAEVKAKGFCRSRQLRGSMNRRVFVQNARESRGVVNVPQYWALYFHEGRGIVQPDSAKILVWFRNPRNDPRLDNGLSPIYKSQVRRLTKQQFQFWAKKNKDARAVGAEEPMVVTKLSRRTAPAKANPFLSDRPGGGLFGIENSLQQISTTEAYAHVESFLKSSGLKKKTIVRNI